MTNVRVVEDKLTKAPKGFGYVEFETVEGLQKALDLSGSSLQGRSIRTSVAEPRKFSSKTTTSGPTDKLCSQGVSHGRT